MFEYFEHVCIVIVTILLQYLIGRVVSWWQTADEFSERSHTKKDNSAGTSSVSADSLKEEPAHDVTTTTDAHPTDVDVPLETKQPDSHAPSGSGNIDIRYHTDKDKDGRALSARNNEVEQGDDAESKSKDVCVDDVVAPAETEQTDSKTPSVTESQMSPLQPDSSNDSGKTKTSSSADWSKGNPCSEGICEVWISRYVALSQARVHSKKAEQIADSLYSHLKMILEKVAVADKRFAVSELLKVGSFYEGTKVLDPDEFDFLAVIDELSKPDAVKAKKITHQPGYAVITLNDDGLKDRWEHTKKTGLLANFQEPNEKGSFCFAVMSVLEKMVKEQGQTYNFDHKRGRGYISNRGLWFTNVNDVNLTLKSVSTLNPNFCLHFDMNGKAIDVDLTPAIRYHNVWDCFDPEYCVDPRIADAVLGRGSILLVNQDAYTGKKAKKAKDKEHLFRISFTETEVCKMTEMIWHHKHLYTFLKLFKTKFHECTGEVNSMLHGSLTSYILKMASISHNAKCEDPTLACLFKVIPLLQSYFKEDVVPSVFNDKLSVLKKNKSCGSLMFFKALFKLMESLNYSLLEDDQFDPMEHLEATIKAVTKLDTGVRKSTKSRSGI